MVFNREYSVLFFYFAHTRAQKTRELINQGSDDIPVYITSAPGFETWNSSRDPSETNLAWVEILAMVQFCAIDHALFWRFCDFKIKITPLLIGIRTSAWL